MTARLGELLHSFFVDHLRVLKGLRPSSVRSYRDTMRLFLSFVATDRRRRITHLAVEDLSFDRVQRFLRYLEEARHNHARTRNQRLAVLHTFFDYLGSRLPEHLAVAERVAAIPTKRTAPPETRFLERDEVNRLFSGMPTRGCHADRDRALLLFLYNTGARVQEVADLRVGHLDLDATNRVRLHGKGDKWRVCPLWPETVRRLRQLLDRHSQTAESAVFVSSRDRPLTRFGIYKIVRRHARSIDQDPHLHGRSISPHVFRHNTASSITLRQSEAEDESRRSSSRSGRRHSELLARATVVDRCDRVVAERAGGRLPLRVPPLLEAVTDHSFLRNSRSRSPGRKRPGRVEKGAVRESARSFRARSASR